MTQAVWRLILNGKTSGDEAVREAVMAMREQGQALQVRVTWEAGDAERLVHEAIADRVAVIIAGGGDGGRRSDGDERPGCRCRARAGAVAAGYRQ